MLGDCTMFGVTYGYCVGLLDIYIHYVGDRKARLKDRK